MQYKYNIARLDIDRPSNIKRYVTKSDQFSSFFTNQKYNLNIF